MRQPNAARCCARGRTARLTRHIEGMKKSQPVVCGYCEGAVPPSRRKFCSLECARKEARYAYKQRKRAEKIIARMTRYECIRCKAKMTAPFAPGPRPLRCVPCRKEIANQANRIYSARSKARARAAKVAA